MAQDRSDRMAGETSAPMWISTLETLGRQFEAERATFPDLYHWLSLATPAFGARKHGHPIVSSANSTQIITDHGERTIWSMARGIAYGDAKKGYLYTAGYFGGKDDRESVLGAIDEFDRLGEAVARCLPAHIARSLAIPPYLDPRCGGTTLQWILALYAIAWRSDPASGISADRRVDFLVPGKPCYGLDLEHLLRLPDVIRSATTTPGSGVILLPPTTKEEVIGCHLNSGIPDGPTWAQLGVRFPPDWFFAFLQPDVFLASKLAIDVILQAWRPVPSPRSTNPPLPIPRRDFQDSPPARGPEPDRSKGVPERALETWNANNWHAEARGLIRNEIATADPAPPDRAGAIRELRDLVGEPPRIHQAIAPIGAIPWLVRVAQCVRVLWTAEFQRHAQNPFAFASITKFETGVPPLRDACHWLGDLCSALLEGRASPGSDGAVLAAFAGVGPGRIEPPESEHGRTHGDWCVLGYTGENGADTQRSVKTLRTIVQYTQTAVRRLLREVEILATSPVPESPASTPMQSDSVTVESNPSALAEGPSPTVRPHLRRPIPVAVFAQHFNKHISNSLTRIRNAKGLIDEDANPKNAELDDIVRVFPKLKKRILEWADKEFPAAPEE